MRLVLSFILCAAAFAQETKVAPEQIRAAAAPVFTVLAWDPAGKFIPLRIGSNLSVNQSGGFWYIDAALPPSTPPDRFVFTAAAGQTVFTITSANVYRDVWVYRNGLLGSSPGDYTASADFKTVTMVVPATAGDSYQIFGIR